MKVLCSLVLTFSLSAAASPCGDLSRPLSPVTVGHKLGDRHFLLSKLTSFDQLKLQAEAFSVRSIEFYTNNHSLPGQGSVPVFLREAPQMSASALRQKINEVLAFSFAQFERQGSLTLLTERLSQVAIKLVGFSRYMNVRDLSQVNRPIVGTIRLISMPYIAYQRLSDGKIWVDGLAKDFRIEIDPVNGPKLFNPLPLSAMESILEYSIKRPAVHSGFRLGTADGEVYAIGIGHVVEPGNFAILNSHPRRKEIFDILGLELLVAHYSEFESVQGSGSFLQGGFNTPLYTYGKELSERMYRRLGFVRQDETQNYAVLTHSMGGLNQVLDRKRRSSGLHPTISEAYENFFSQLMDSVTFVWTPETHTYNPFFIELIESAE